MAKNIDTRCHIVSNWALLLPNEWTLFADEDHEMGLNSPEKANMKMLNWRYFVKELVTKHVLFSVLEVCGDSVISVDRLLLCCTFLPLVFVVGFFRWYVITLCRSVLIRHKHKSLWLPQSFTVNAVTDYYQHLPSLHFVIIRSSQRGNRALRLGDGRIFDYLSLEKSPKNVPVQPKLPMYASFPFNNSMYSNVSSSSH